MHYYVSFPGSSYSPCLLPAGQHLSEELTVLNSPVLFGCRTGICGTCLVQIEEGFETLNEASSDEKEALLVYTTRNQKSRLACQIDLNCDIALKKIETT